MPKLLKKLVFVFIFPGFVTFYPAALNAETLPAEEYNIPVKDTIEVLRLFAQGNQFIDGPSDSLLAYYNKALQIIKQNIKLGDKSQTVYSVSVIKRFKQLEQRAYIEIGIEYFFRSNYERALDNYFNALEIASEIKDTSVMSECYSEIGIVFKNQGNLDKALDYYNQSLKLAALGNDSSWTASCMINIGNIYKEKMFLVTSLGYYLDALKILEKLDKSRRVAACYQSIGDIYSKQLDFEKAFEYFNKALSLSLQTNDRVRESSCYMNIGYVFSQENDFDKAREYYNKALQLYEMTGYKHELDDCYILIGNSWMQQNDDEQAISWYLKAMAISEEEQDNSRLAEITGNLGKIFFRKEEYKKAEEYCLQSLSYAKQSSSIDLQAETYFTLSEIYESTGQADKALRHYKLYSTLKDSIFNAEKYKTISEMEIKYETDQKAQQLSLLQEKTEIQMLKLSLRNRLLIAMGLVIILVFLVGYLLIRHNRLKAKQKATDLEQRLLLSQMNPHFIFNSLIAIQSFIYQKDPLLAGDFLAKFAELVRITLESSRSEFISLEKEIKMLHSYLALQKLRFENKFDFTVSLHDAVNIEGLQIPPMFAQPFIENAIEHGLRHRNTGGLLKVSYSILDKCCIQVRIEDNGVGREISRQIENKQKHQSMALSITNERLAILSKAFKRKFTLIMIDLTDDDNKPAGLKVVIEIPVQLISNFNQANQYK